VQLFAQQDTVLNKQAGEAAENPNNFFTRTELFNKVTALRNGGYLNATTFRTIINLGKGFTTRFDIPVSYNSLPAPPGFNQFGLGDISIRVLGYKLIENPKSAIVASLEMSFNTASSPLLGTGKNILIPTVTYSSMAKSRKTVVALSALYFNSISGDKLRPDINFSKLQFFLIHLISRNTWYTIRPDWYFDHKYEGVSMNIDASIGHALTKKSNIWFRPGIGLFGNHPARYKWSLELGYRKFLYTNPFKKSKKSQ